MVLGLAAAAHLHRQEVLLLCSSVEQGPVAGLSHRVGAGADLLAAARLAELGGRSPFAHRQGSLARDWSGGVGCGEARRSELGTRPCSAIMGPNRALIIAGGHVMSYLFSWSSASSARR